MPYKNIIFAKLEKRLFNDHRWYMMSEPAQLNYIRFILFAAETYNKIPKNIEAIKKAFKTNQTESEIFDTIKEIKLNFPKFKENKHFYYFDGFEEKTNYIPKRAIRRKSQVLPKDSVYIDKEEDKEKEEYKEDKEKEGTHLVCSYFYSRFKDIFNKEYIANFGKDGKIFKDLLTIIPIDELKKLIDIYLTTPDRFVEENGYSVGVFKSRINSLRMGKRVGLFSDKAVKSGIALNSWLKKKDAEDAK